MDKIKLTKRNKNKNEKKKPLNLVGIENEMKPEDIDDSDFFDNESMFKDQPGPDLNGAISQSMNRPVIVVLILASLSILFLITIISSFLSKDNNKNINSEITSLMGLNFGSRLIPNEAELMIEKNDSKLYVIENSGKNIKKDTLRIGVNKDDVIYAIERKILFNNSSACLQAKKILLNDIDSKNKPYKQSLQYNVYKKNKRKISFKDDCLKSGPYVFNVKKVPSIIITGLDSSLRPLSKKEKLNNSLENELNLKYTFIE